MCIIYIYTLSAFWKASWIVEHHLSHRQWYNRLIYGRIKPLCWHLTTLIYFNPYKIWNKTHIPQFFGIFGISSKSNTSKAAPSCAWPFGPPLAWRPLPPAAARAPWTPRSAAAAEASRQPIAAEFHEFSGFAMEFLLSLLSFDEIWNIYDI